MAFGDERRHMYAQRKKQSQLLPTTGAEAGSASATSSSETTISQNDVLQTDETVEDIGSAKNVTLSMLNNW